MRIRLLMIGGIDSNPASPFQLTPETPVIAEPTVEKTDPSWRLKPWGLFLISGKALGG